MKLYYHKTDGGAEYLTDTHLPKSREGSFTGKTKYVVRVDGDITKDAELIIREAETLGYANVQRLRIKKEVKMVKDDKGTQHKDCPEYYSGLCHWNDGAAGRVAYRCTGTHLCNPFWEWFLKEQKLYPGVRK